MREALAVMQRACAASAAVIGITCAAASITANGPGVFAVSNGAGEPDVFLGPHLTVTGWVLVVTAIALVAAIAITHRATTIALSVAGLAATAIAVLRLDVDAAITPTSPGYPIPGLGTILGLGVLFLGTLAAASLIPPRRKPRGGLLVLILIASAVFCWQSGVYGVESPRAFGWYPLAITGIVLTVAAGWMVRRAGPHAWLGFLVPAIGWLMVGWIGPALPSMGAALSWTQLLGCVLIAALVAIGRLTPIKSAGAAR